MYVYYWLNYKSLKGWIVSRLTMKNRDIIFCQSWKFKKLHFKKTNVKINLYSIKLYYCTIITHTPVSIIFIIIFVYNKSLYGCIKLNCEKLYIKKHSCTPIYTDKSNFSFFHSIQRGNTILYFILILLCRYLSCLKFRQRISLFRKNRNMQQLHAYDSAINLLINCNMCFI